jgi:hypothetical protein
LIIVGVSESAKSMSELSVPRFAGGKPVLAIGERAFSGCGMLEKVTVGDNIAQFYDNVFEGCGRLEMITLQTSEAGALAVGDNFLGGANGGCRIYLSREAFGNFAVDYFWGKYSGRMEILP